ncbi:MAG: hypothetical protein H0T73_21725 [Ardenticatenales bacterium]|nr:hypothetical protein [Ardenticatenales bacterium]
MNPIEINPYIAGNPVGGGGAFVGRADVLRKVLRIAGSPHQNALVLYGPQQALSPLNRGATTLIERFVDGAP